MTVFYFFFFFFFTLFLKDLGSSIRSPAVRLPFLLFVLFSCIVFSYSEYFIACCMSL